jgi:dolichol-phosphate mannosyltransferase
MKNKLSDSDSLAVIRVNTAISIIIPTFREFENIPHILARLNTFRKANDLDIEVLFMDDNSQDGSVEAVNASGFEWARIIVRTSNRGLSNAVIDGFRAASYAVVVCMDCDLSNPPEEVPHMVMGLASGQQMVIGSRYVPGASTDDDWGLLRWLNRIVATLLARPRRRNWRQCNYKLPSKSSLYFQLCPGWQLPQSIDCVPWRIRCRRSCQLLGCAASAKLRFA